MTLINGQKRKETEALPQTSHPSRACDIATDHLLGDLAVPCCVAAEESQLLLFVAQSFFGRGAHRAHVPAAAFRHRAMQTAAD